MEKVLLVDLRDGTRWQLLFEDDKPDLARLLGPNGEDLAFTRAQVGTTCDFTTRGDDCTVTMPTKGLVRTFGCSVEALQPFLYWIRSDLAPWEHARIARELLFAIPLGLLWGVAGSPLLSHGVSRWLIGMGAALFVLGIVGRVRPARWLLLVDAALWFGLAVHNARVAYGGNGVLAVLLTLFSASYALRVIRTFAFHQALARA